ncbi:Acyl-coenzyme A dehydrogenase [compost metagenome]
MIFGQGAIRCHPFVLKEMALAGREDHDQALKEFDHLLMQHIGFAVGNAASTLVLGLGLGHFEKVPGDALSQGYFRALNRQAAAFALLADLCMMLLGGELKRRERLSARLGDVLSHLYLSSAALKRYHDLNSPEHLQPLLRWALEESLGQAEKALDRLLDNFPNRFLGCALRLVVFPFGRRHTGPGDELDAEIAELIGRAKGDPALEELLAGCYRPQADGDPVAALQQAYDQLSAGEPLRKKLHQALKSGQVVPAPGESVIDAALHAGVLQASEAQSLHAAESARRRVIDVDAFDKEQLLPADGKIR